MKYYDAAIVLLVSLALVGFATPECSCAGSKVSTGGGKIGSGGKIGGGKVGTPGQGRSRAQTKRGNTAAEGPRGRQGSTNASQGQDRGRGKSSRNNVGSSEQRGRGNVGAQGKSEERGRGSDNVGAKGKTEGRGRRADNAGTSNGGRGRTAERKKDGLSGLKAKCGDYPTEWRGYRDGYYYYGGWRYRDNVVYDAFWVDAPAEDIDIGTPFFWPAYNVFILPMDGGVYQYGPTADGPWTERSPDMGEVSNELPVDRKM
ncbi:MAG TPA: hypothetical protein VEI57_17545 [Nitrospirota bacterium]|nr:hypothetical protein [Nitrospirota bacterium]